MDVYSNVVGMRALYNATYRRLAESQKGAEEALSEAEIRKECERVVQNASPHMFKLFDLEHIGSGEWARLRGFFTLERIMCLTSLIVSVILQVV